LARFLDSFEPTDTGVQIGAGSTLIWVLRQFLVSPFSVGCTVVVSEDVSGRGADQLLDRAPRPTHNAAPHAAQAASVLYS
jgi:hypothetical protein